MAKEKPTTRPLTRGRDPFSFMVADAEAPDTPAARRAMRDSIMEGKKDFEANLPPSNLTTSMKFIENAVKKKLDK